MDLFARNVAKTHVGVVENPSGQNMDVLNGTHVLYADTDSYVQLAIRSFADDAYVDFSIDDGKTWIAKGCRVQGFSGEVGSQDGFPGPDFGINTPLVKAGNRLMLNIRSVAGTASRILYSVSYIDAIYPQ